MNAVVPQVNESVETNLADHIHHRYEEMKRKRDGFKPHYRVVAKYVLMRPALFGDAGAYTTPTLSMIGVSNDDAVDAARTAATAIGGALWPNTAESFEIVPRTPPNIAFDADELFQTEDIKNYFQSVTRIMRSVIDHPLSGFSVALAEYFDDQMSFGTSGIVADEDENSDDCPIKFRSAGVETSVLDEGPNGSVDTVYLEYCYSVRQMVMKYKRDNVSEEVRQAYDAGKLNEMIRVIQAIEPRPEGKPDGMNDEKPYRSIHMEVKSKKILKRSGMSYLCVFMTRFRKRTNEMYGRSLSMDALQTIKSLNLLQKGYDKALDKILDPPVGYWSDQIGGGGEVNLTAGAKVPLYNTGRIDNNTPPVVPLITVKEPQSADARIQSLIERLTVKFLIDRLLDFNNKTRMTANETDKRSDLRNQALGNIFSRQITELLHPLVTYVFRLLWDRKLLGLHPDNDAHQIFMMRAAHMAPLVIPQAIADQMVNSKHIPFVVKFISPAARAMQAESLMGLEATTNYVGALLNLGFEEARDTFDAEDALRQHAQLSGCPTSTIKGKDRTKEDRATRQQAQGQQAQLQGGEIQATIDDKKSKTALNYSKAGTPQLIPQLQQQAQQANQQMAG